MRPGRSVLLCDAACDCCAACRAGAPRLRVLRPPPNGHIIDIEYYWINALKRAKLRRVRLHDLRHSFAASACGSGVNLQHGRGVAWATGPEDDGRYAHMTREASAAALDALRRCCRESKRRSRRKLTEAEEDAITLDLPGGYRRSAIETIKYVKD